MKTWRWLVLWLLVLAVLLVVNGSVKAEPIIIGTEPKSVPGHLQAAEDIVANKQALGTDPAPAVTAAALVDLADPADPTKNVTLDLTTVPGNMCTDGTAGLTWANTEVCAKIGTAFNTTLDILDQHIVTIDDEDWYEFRCTPSLKRQRKSAWVQVKCP